ncbi:MAG: enoyl-CoA hydratase/isomerase family protein [Xanthomonadales bacterium]|jgi:enoyl-CoA hydratase/carnithine racemase|nr:enoyl-CoA hydratase/isomerase family protein [Xanthomonadales bacterium]
MLDMIDHGPIREIRLARPPANALNKPLFEALDAALTEAAESASAVVLSGLPGMFSAGLDVPELLQLDRAAFNSVIMRFLQTCKTIATMPIPTAFALTGHAPAGGMVLAVFGDYRIMAGGSYKTGLNEVQVGLLVPSTVHRTLVRLLGAHQAERILVAGELMDAQRAAEIGLVDELAENPEQAVLRALEWCKRQLALPAHAMQKMRAEARADIRALFERSLEGEAEAFTEMWFREDTRSILTAMVEKLKKR